MSKTSKKPTKAKNCQIIMIDNGGKTSRRSNQIRLNKDLQAALNEFDKINPNRPLERASFQAMKEAASLIRNAREYSNASQLKIANALNVHQSQISRNESSVAPDVSNANNKAGITVGFLAKILHSCGYQLVLSIKKR